MPRPGSSVPRRILPPGDRVTCKGGAEDVLVAVRVHIRGVEPGGCVHGGIDGEVVEGVVAVVAPPVQAQRRLIQSHDIRVTVQVHVGADHGAHVRAGHEGRGGECPVALILTQG